MSKADESYVQALYKTLDYSNGQFDKNVLLIASGALGASFTFIDKLVPNLEVAISKNYLINAWYWFASVIFISLLSHFISTLSIRWSIINHNKTKFSKGMKRWNYLIRFLNVFMIFGLLIGIVLLINFINLNISKP